MEDIEVLSLFLPCVIFCPMASIAQKVAVGKGELSLAPKPGSTTPRTSLYPG
jgi:hypothetical protein